MDRFWGGRSCEKFQLLAPIVFGRNYLAILAERWEEEHIPLLQVNIYGVLIYHLNAFDVSEKAYLTALQLWIDNSLEAEFHRMGVDILAIGKLDTLFEFKFPQQRVECPVGLRQLGNDFALRAAKNQLVKHKRIVIIQGKSGNSVWVKGPHTSRETYDNLSLRGGNSDSRPSNHYSQCQTKEQILLHYFPPSNARTLRCFRNPFFPKNSGTAQIFRISWNLRK